MSLPGRTGTTYYVSATGSDAAAGTSPATAWQTITKVNASTFVAGDSIRFKGGNSFSGALVFSNSNASGTATSPITVDVYNSSTPATINSTTSAGLTVTNTAGIIFRNLTFVGSGGGNTTPGLSFNNSQASNTKLSFVWLENLDVSGYGYNGIEFVGSNGTSGFTNVSLINVASHGNTLTYNGANGSSGIVTYSTTGYGSGRSNPSHTNIYIYKCQAYNNIGAAGSTNWVGSGILIGEAANAVITNCVAHHNGSANTFSGGPIGIWAFDSVEVVIQNSESYSNSTSASGIDGGGFGLDGGTFGCIIQDNYSHNNQGAGFQLYSYNDGTVTAANDNIIRYNITENDATFNSSNQQASINVGMDSAIVNNFQIYNNTVYQSGASSIAVGFRNGGGTLSGIFTNNIIYTNGKTLVHTAATNPSGVSLFNNDYFFSAGSFSVNWNNVAYSSFAAWQAAVPAIETFRGANVGLTSDPGLTNVGAGGTLYPAATTTLNAYKFAGASPMINAGLDPVKNFAVSPGTVDYFGTAIPAGIDVGAYEKP